MTQGSTKAALPSRQTCPQCAVVREATGAHATLIIAASDTCHRSVTDCVARLGRRSITVRHPLEAIICLQDDAVSIDVVLAPAHDLGFATLEWFAFMRAEFPRVLRIAYEKSSAEDPHAPDASLIDLTMTYRTPPPRLAEALPLLPEDVEPTTGLAATARNRGS